MAAQLRFHPDPSPVLGDLPDRRAAEAWLWPGHRSGNGQARLPRRGPDLRGSPAVGPDELAHLRPARGARARSALGPHLLPGPPTCPRSTRLRAVWRRTNRLVGHGWAPPPARYARARVGPGGHAGGGHYRAPRSSRGRRTVAFPALALDGLAPHLTGKGPDDLLFAARKGGQLAQALCAARRIGAAARQIPRT